MTRHQRRATDRPLTARLRIRVRDNWYRDVLLLALALLWLVLAINLSHTNDRVQQGRRFAVGATCAVESAVATAGYQVLLNSAAPSPAIFLYRLEQLGYQPPTTHARRLAAEAYVRSISQRVENAIGPNHLVRKDGTLDCARLQRLSDTRS